MWLLWRDIEELLGGGIYAFTVGSLEAHSFHKHLSYFDSSFEAHGL